MTGAVTGVAGFSVSSADLPPPAALLPYVAALLDGDVEIDRVPAETIEETSDGGFVASGAGTRFAATAAWAQSSNVAGRWDVTLEMRLDAGPPVAAGIRVAIRIGSADDPRWLVPGQLYGENRPPASRARFPRWVPAAEETRDDPFAASGWSFRADRAATPCVSGTAEGVTVTLAAAGDSPLGQPGVGLAGGGRDGAPIELRLHWPYREEPVVYDGGPAPLAAEAPGHRWQPGETVRLAFRVYLARAGLQAWAAAIRDLAPSPSDATIPTLDIETAARLAAEGLLAWHYREEDAALYETAGFDRVTAADARTDRAAMHVAWLSGVPAATALIRHGLRSGNGAAVEAGRRVLDGICSNLAPCGSFWSQWTADRGWGKGWAAGPDAVHTRTTAEATQFALRAAGIAGRADDVDPRLWHEAAASNLRFIAARQRDDGALPASWNGRTGEPLGWAGSAALAWIPPLLDGAATLGDGSLAAAARRTGRHYEGFVDGDFLFGAPEDVDLGPTSEDGYVALMAYVALAEAASTPDERARWLDLATRAATWALTFRYSWDVSFPADSTLGRRDVRTTGLDVASPANQHLHVYGLVCVPELARLGRMTRDAWLVRRAREHFVAARQMIVREDGDLGGRRGMMPERAFQTRYGQKGEVDRLSHAWCLGLLLWASEEVRAMSDLADEAREAASRAP
ncbi:MAG: hypothetical protein ACJ765_07395 [Chloroflexota bacterium]